MRKIREILRLRFESKLSHEKIARALNVSKGVVNKYLSLCHREGVQWPLPPDLDDAALEAKLFGRPGRPRITTSFVEPNFVQIHQDLKKTGVTFWAPRFVPSRKGTDWLKVLKTLVCYRLIDPSSEWRLHRQWYERSAMGDLLGGDAALVQADTLYRCHDKLVVYKQELLSAYALGDIIQRKFRGAALRFDEHLFCM
jgi:hypothetical protein